MRAQQTYTSHRAEPLPRDIRRVTACQLLGTDLDADALENARIAQGQDAEAELAQPSYYASILTEHKPRTLEEMGDALVRWEQRFNALVKDFRAYCERVDGIAARETI